MAWPMPILATSASLIAGPIRKAPCPNLTTTASIRAPPACPGTAETWGATKPTPRLAGGLDVGGLDAGGPVAGFACS